MAFKLDDIKYDQSRFRGVPESPDEELVWKALDHIDQVLTQLATTLLVGGIDEGMLPPPPAPAHLKVKITEAAHAYFDEINKSLDTLRDAGLLPPQD